MKATLLGGGRLALASLACVVGCASVAPLAPLAVKWGADLISAAANNYSPQYSQQVESLLLAVYSDQVAKRAPGQQAGQAAQAAYPSAAGQAQPSPDSAYPASPTQADPYSSIGAAPSNPYPSQASSLVSGQQPYGASTPSSPPAGSSAATSPIVLDVAILAQRSSDRAARRT